MIYRCVYFSLAFLFATSSLLIAMQDQEDTDHPNSCRALILYNPNKLLDSLKTLMQEDKDDNASNSTKIVSTENIEENSAKKPSERSFSGNFRPQYNKFPPYRYKTFH